MAFRFQQIHKKIQLTPKFSEAAEEKLNLSLGCFMSDYSCGLNNVHTYTKNVQRELSCQVESPSAWNAIFLSADNLYCMEYIQLSKPVLAV